MNLDEYLINLDEYRSVEADWIALYLCIWIALNGDNVTYFESFGVKYILIEIEKFISNKTITTNVYRIQAYNSIMCRYFCIGFIDFMLKGKTPID